ncbi:MAG: TetR/AcrR family transcriptional regulator [Candidatus Eisenbacteria bacterium]|uniref:TetR/AcrR family transcriptional regulator n=1 Tax=Eiseniibacteriota bacterium TaxID=2212470 RepID=A0A956SDK4_UNCEI|nr:TetR/AcrR family transcriptional regulator [Candidatus Eisenbacteria bacterium]MCB9466139.1 TetR/AcrR family transcriptional regulator [Candidatus Eisenbacteria bacterium]
MEQRDKSEKVEAVAEWTLRIIDAHGLDGVSIARVARAASVSRPWMYKYVGRGKEELIEVAVRRFGMLISGLDRRPRLDSRENWVHDTMANTQRLFLNSRERPWMLRLYYRFKGTHTVLGEVIADLESRYLGAHTREIAEVWGMPEEESRILAESLMAARLGMAHRYQYREEVEEDDRGRFFALLRRWLSGISPGTP